MRYALILHPSSFGRRSDDRNAGAFLAALAVVVHPGEFDFPARFGDRVELKIGVSGDAGSHSRSEDLHAVIAGDKIVDDILRDRTSAIVESKAGLHGMMDGHLDLDDLAAPGLLRHLHSGYHEETTPFRSIPRDRPVRNCLTAN